MAPTTERPKLGEIEERQAPALEVEGKKIRGRVPYGIESRDMGGWREVIDPGALDATNLDDLVATVDHAGVPIGRYPTTLDLEDRSDGLHWAVTPPETRADVREAIERGDLKAGSWRMVVGREEWRGDVRHVRQIAELRDVSVVTNPSYPSSEVELRSKPDTIETKEADMAEAEKTEERSDEQRSDEKTEKAEAAASAGTDRDREPAGSLKVEDRAGNPGGRGLADEFRAAGFPGEKATISWDEFRTATFSGSIDDLNPTRQVGVPLGADQRYAYPAFPQVSVDGATTSVQVLSQSSRTLPPAGDVIRDIDETSAKPEVASEVKVDTVPLQQVAAVQTSIPNVVLAQPTINSVVETDLRLALNAGLDNLVEQAILSSTPQELASDSLLVAIRKAITTIQYAGYSPDTLLLPPWDSEELDTLSDRRARGVLRVRRRPFRPRAAVRVERPGQRGVGRAHGRRRCRVRQALRLADLARALRGGRRFDQPVDGPPRGPCRLRRRAPRGSGADQRQLVGMAPEGEADLRALARRFDDAERRVQDLLDRAPEGNRRELLTEALDLLVALRREDLRGPVITAYLAAFRDVRSGGGAGAVRDLAGSLAKRLDGGARTASESVRAAFRTVTVENIEEITAMATIAHTDAAGNRWGLGAWAGMNTTTIGRQATSRGTRDALPPDHKVVIDVGECGYCQEFAGEYPAARGALAAVPPKLLLCCERGLTLGGELKPQTTQRAISAAKAWHPRAELLAHADGAVATVLARQADGKVHVVLYRDLDARR